MSAEDMRAYALSERTAERTDSERIRAKLDRALTLCRCAARVVDSNAYQGTSDEAYDLRLAVRNWRAIWPDAGG